MWLNDEEYASFFPTEQIVVLGPTSNNLFKVQGHKITVPIVNADGTAYESEISGQSQNNPGKPPADPPAAAQNEKNPPGKKK